MHLFRKGDRLKEINNKMESWKLFKYLQTLQC